MDTLQADFQSNKPHVVSVRHFIIAVIIACVFLTSIPHFFDIYRMTAFNVVPRDDYAPYLLYFLGREGGEIPVSPFAYRFLPIILSIPFYYTPRYTFSNLDQIAPDYLQAIQALCLTNYLAQVMTTVVLYFISYRRFRASRLAAILIAFAGWNLFGFMAQAGVDATSILLISLLTYFQDNRRIFIPLMLVSPGFNEKIAIIFCVWMGTRSITTYSLRKCLQLDERVWVSAMALVIYVGIVLVFHLPGNIQQTDPAFWWSNIQATMSDTLTLKGLILNIIPIMILIMIAFLSDVQSVEITRIKLKASHVTWLPLITMVVLSFLVNVHFNVGRIAMYTFPLFLPTLGPLIDQLSQNQPLSKIS